MRLKLFAIAGFAAALAGPAAAQTYDPDYPVCIHYYGNWANGDHIDCSFSSIPQCQATASGIAASCLVNPYFAPPPPPPQRRARRARHH